MNGRQVITLTTDFGARDGFVGAMKGVILSVNPNARIVDISHDTPRQDVLAGAIVLANAARYFPAGCVHVAVVDPGVGSDRRALAAVCDSGLYVAPDNGLLTMVDRHDPIREAYAIENPAFRLPELSATFHGRDLFAPAAAHLSLGKPPADAGAPVANIQRLAVPEHAWNPTAGQARGEVLYVDIYGNLITNIPNRCLDDLGGTCRLTIGGQDIAGPRRAYNDAAPGELLFLPGSSGLVEIAVNMGNAADALKASRGGDVILAGLEKDPFPKKD